MSVLMHPSVAEDSLRTCEALHRSETSGESFFRGAPVARGRARDLAETDLNTRRCRRNGIGGRRPRERGSACDLELGRAFGRGGDFEPASELVTGANSTFSVTDAAGGGMIELRRPRQARKRRAGAPRSEEKPHAKADREGAHARSIPPAPTAASNAARVGRGPGHAHPRRRPWRIYGPLIRDAFDLGTTTGISWASPAVSSNSISYYNDPLPSASRFLRCWGPLTLTFTQPTSERWASGSEGMTRASTPNRMSASRPSREAFPWARSPPPPT